MTSLVPGEAVEPPGRPDLVAVRDLAVEFPLPRRGLGRRPTIRAVAGVSFDVGVGETLGLVGESGSGKTTVGRAILGLVTPTAGSICFDGTELTRLSSSQRRRFSTEMQIVFQNPYTSLNPALRVGDAIGEALRVHRGLRGEELEGQVASLLQRVGLDPSAAKRRPHAFSGGQRQRIAIARAIALDPRFVIYDEAVSALDLSTRGQIINLMADLRRELGLSSLFIGHDLAVVRHISERIAVLYRGHLVEIGPATAVADRPQHPYTRRLVESVLPADPDDPAHLGGQERRPRSAAPQRGGCPYAGECPERVPLCDEAAPEPRRVAGGWVACHLVAEAPPRAPVAVCRPPASNGSVVRERLLACVEIGGGSIQTVVFARDGVRYADGVVVPDGADVAMAVPGLVRHGRVVMASSLGWRDVDAATMVGLRRPPVLVCNDAEAAALGEWTLRGRPSAGLVFVGLGTGVGGAVVDGRGGVITNLLGHQPGFSDARCKCGATGCLETMAAGWALPVPIDSTALHGMARAVATAIDREPAAADIDSVVVSGGLVDRYSDLVELLAGALPSRAIATSVRPPGAKSAAPWGLSYLVGDRA